MNLIKLVMGDWSGDGHEKTSSVVVQSSHTLEQVVNAYRKAVKITDLNVIKDVACDYEEPYLSIDQIRIIHKFCPDYFKSHVERWTTDEGVTHVTPWESRESEEIVGGYDENRKYVTKTVSKKYLIVDTEDKYMDLVLRWIKIGDPSIVITPVSLDGDFNIGGYGLF